jgi:hypothetical protein
MANVLPLSALAISKIETLSGYHSSGISNITRSATNLSNSYITTPIAFKVLSVLGYYTDYKSNTLYTNSYNVLPLSTLNPNWTLTVGTDVDTNTYINTSLDGYIDHNVSLWVNINGGKTSTNVLSCYPTANLYEPKSGQRNASSSSTFLVGNLPVKTGDKLYFYLGAGPRKAGAGWYWSKTNITLTTTQAAILSTSPVPVRLSEYYQQDLNTPIVGQPIRFSNFLGAVNYIPDTTILFNKVPYNHQYQIATVDDTLRTTLVPNLVTKLADLNANSIIRTRSSSDASAANLNGTVSTTYAMLNGVLNFNTFGSTSSDPITFYIQKNSNTINLTLATATSSVIAKVNPTIGDFLSYLNLNAAAPAVVNVLGQEAADPLINHNRGTLYINSNSKNILNQLIVLSNQANPTQQYSLNITNNYFFIFEYITFTIITKKYYQINTPLCYKVTGSSINLSKIPVNLGDVLTIYAYKGNLQNNSLINGSIHVQNNLLLNL